MIRAETAAPLGPSRKDSSARAGKISSGMGNRTGRKISVLTAAISA